MKRTPFLLFPAAKDYLWGGSRLNDDFNLALDASPLAEAWVCSTHPDGESSVPAFSCTLSSLLKNHPDFLGSHTLETTKGKPELPILIKFIDARKDLSVQVHPDDEYALQHEGQLGKTEMWYVLDARPGAELIYGFNREVTKEQIREAIGRGEIDSFLNRVPIHKNDLFFITPGTVHAIGAGALIAEVQEASNITYRLYDYDRVDKTGKKRPLHVDQALDVLNLQGMGAVRQPMRLLKYRRGYASELLSRCRYFQAERVLLNTEVYRRLVDYKTTENSFHALLCFDGCGSISGENFMLNFFKGDCIFVSSDSIPLKLHGKAHLLDVSC